MSSNTALFYIVVLQAHDLSKPKHKATSIDTSVTLSPATLIYSNWTPLVGMVSFRYSLQEDVQGGDHMVEKACE